VEFGEKLQMLRKRRGFTQEELAEAIYVSRTAVSKWESGRGYPNIDSLKALAAFFSVTIDELLTEEKEISVAETQGSEAKCSLRDRIFGLVDCTAVGFFFLPIFGQPSEGIVRAVPVGALTGLSAAIKAVYLIIIIGMTLTGFLSLAMQTCGWSFWNRNGWRISLTLTAVGTLVFILSPQPYAGTLMLLFLVIKAFAWKKDVDTKRVDHVTA